MPKLKFEPSYNTKLQMLKSEIISRGSELQVYNSLIRPYAAETWTLTVAEENALTRFELKVLRKVCGPVMDNGVWKIRYNSELYKFMGELGIVRFIKAQRIQWLGHVERMPCPKECLNENCMQ